MATFSERLQLALDRNDMTAADLSRKTGISEASISQYLKGTVTAKQDKIYLISQALNVSPVWLMAFDDPDEHLQSLQVAVIYRQLPEDLQKQALNFMLYLKSEARRREEQKDVQD